MLKHAINAIIKVKNAKFVILHNILFKHMMLKRHRNAYLVKWLAMWSASKDINAEYI